MISEQLNLHIQHGLVDYTENADSDSIKLLLEALNEINSDTIEEEIKTTRMMVLFEGFYQSVANPRMKKTLSTIRQQCWQNHMGTPTILFLLTHDKLIRKTSLVFQEHSVSKPWLQVDIAALMSDVDQHVLVDLNVLDNFEIPEKEKTGKLIKTNNPSGGFTTTPSDPVSQEFIKHAEQTSGTGGAVLEIGAAFGTATLEALERGATVYCNDIDPKNLAVVRKRYAITQDLRDSAITGDNDKLKLIPGSCPDELIGLPKNFFDAILACRVLHFLTGTQIDTALELLFSLLKPGGKLYIVCETPFQKNWITFMPEYQRRVQEGWAWTGEIEDTTAIESTGRASSLPKFIHCIDEDSLRRALENGQYEVVRIAYIDRRGQFPEEILLDGRESIGAIAMKPF